MDNEDLNEERKIVDFREGIDKNKFIKNKKLDYEENLNEDLLRDLKDYASLEIINSIKNNVEYSLSKWNIILNHLINLDDYFFYLRNKKLDKQENEEIKKKKKDSQSDTKSIEIDISSSINSINSDSNYDNSYTSSSSSNSLFNSFYWEKNNSIEAKDLLEFELSYINKRFKILDKESIYGNDFEIYVKRYLYIMLFLLKIDYYEFLHAEEALYKKLLDLYGYSNETNTIKFEMDMVVNDFFIKDFQLLLKNFPQPFFFW